MSKNYHSKPNQMNNILKNPVAQAVSQIVTTGDRTWEYITKLSDDVRNHLGSVTSIVLEANNFLSASGTKTNEADVLINGLFGDIKEAAESWRLMSSRHQGKTGVAKDADDYALLTEIGLSYIQLHEQMLLKTQFAAPALQELVTEAEYKLKGVAMVDPTQTTAPVNNAI